MRTVFYSFSLMIFSSLVHAENIERIQVNNCLAKELNPSYKVIQESPGFKILEVPSEDLRQISQIADTASCGRFINVTHKLLHADQKIKLEVLSNQDPLKITHFKEVTTLLNTIEPDNIWSTVNHLSHYTNRSATQALGVETAFWLKKQFDDYASKYHRTDVDSYTISTGGRYKQPSVVTVVGKDLKNAPIVIGAHMDTLGDSAEERMPGAGDDASGSASILEMARTLLASNIQLNRPIYFIWYAAEEQGLVGSQKVVEHFIKYKQPVLAALQFDMTGYRYQNQDTMWLYKDYTSKKFTAFTAQLIKTYLKVPVRYSSCGYGCSDHVSWYFEHVPTVFPCETSYHDHNPNIHSDQDTMDKLSIEHMTHFTALGLAFIVELS